MSSSSSSSRSSRSRSRSRSNHGSHRRGCSHHHTVTIHKGRVIANPYLNFLRLYRAQHSDWPITEISSRGARVWCQMSSAEQAKYRQCICEAAHKRSPESIKKGGSHYRPSRSSQSSGSKTIMKARRGGGRRRSRSRRRRGKR